MPVCRWPAGQSRQQREIAFSPGEARQQNIRKQGPLAELGWRGRGRGLSGDSRWECSLCVPRRGRRAGPRLRAVLYRLFRAVLYLRNAGSTALSASLSLGLGSPRISPPLSPSILFRLSKLLTFPFSLGRLKGVWSLFEVLASLKVRLPIRGSRLNGQSRKPFEGLCLY